MCGDHNVFSDISNLLDYYVAQLGDLRMRHTAIWFEVKHYTWVMSFFIGAGALAVANVREVSPAGYHLAAGLSVFGAAIAIMALLIIRRDFRYFSRAERRLLFLERSLGVMSNRDYLDDRLKLASGPEFSVSNTDYDVIEGINKRSFTPRIRTLVQLSFALYALYGVGQAAFIWAFVL